ncbi:5704_t:CDS:2 [Racocetra fulgida]|uniref:5704_t:CDS:1 n=1 Tax=Racocetra fulgida TaxID=60492 RepID=A0A9N9AYL4_9GLOM|nr:5704_t:CDS:2 [Racocetra fulgida]
MSDHLREELQQKNEATLSSVNGNNSFNANDSSIMKILCSHFLFTIAKDFNLPEELHVYHSLYPLDLRQGKSTAVQIPGVVANIPETVLWSYIVQLASAIKTIHASDLAARMIEPTKILLTGKNR